jgi:two-component system, OmpR family, response regulator CpxR
MKPKKVILCVDENELTLNTRAYMLEVKGYRVLRAMSGVDALKILSAMRVDLIVSELVMRGVDGVRLAEEAKRISPATAIVLASAIAKRFEHPHLAEVFLPAGTPAIELLERIRLLVIRKSGPKPVANATLEKAFAGVARMVPDGISTCA